MAPVAAAGAPPSPSRARPAAAAPRSHRAPRSAPPRTAPGCCATRWAASAPSSAGAAYVDLADGWGGRHPTGVPVYILTHEPPADWPADSTIRFVTDGLESAVAQARAAAAGRDIGVATPGVVRQRLDAGLLDELQINLIPVVLGDGVPFLHGIAREVSLTGPVVIEGESVTHLRYRVAPDAALGGDDAEATARQVTQAGRS